MSMARLRGIEARAPGGYAESLLPAARCWRDRNSCRNNNVVAANLDFHHHTATQTDHVAGSCSCHALTTASSATPRSLVIPTPQPLIPATDNTADHL